MACTLHVGHLVLVETLLVFALLEKGDLCSPQPINVLEIFFHGAFHLLRQLIFLGLHSLYEALPENKIKVRSAKTMMALIKKRCQVALTHHLCCAASESLRWASTCFLGYLSKPLVCPCAPFSYPMCTALFRWTPYSTGVNARPSRPKILTCRPLYR